MAQDRFINITLDANASSRIDRSNDKHGQSLSSVAGGDLTISYDSAKFPSLSLFRSAILSAIQQASGTMKA
jgi:hypothetical protein